MTHKEAVNWIINLSADIGKSEHRELWHYEQALYEIRDVLESEPQWIPVSEDEPKVNREYLVTVIDENGKRIVDRDDYFVYGWDDYGGDERFKVVAWMPSPEPYEEGQDEQT